MTIYEYKYMKSPDEVAIYKKMERDYLKTDITVTEVEGGVILPQKMSPNMHHWMGDGGVIDERGEFVNLSGILGFGENEGDFVFGGAYEYDLAERLEEDVLYMGAFQPHWGHFLLEYVTRLWYWIKYKPNIRIAYCGFSCEPDSMGGNFLEILTLLGIEKERLIDIRKPTKFTKVIVPEQSYLRGKYFSPEYKLIVETLTQNACRVFSQKVYDKVYFTRTDFMKTAANRSKERGEQSIRKLFEQNDFKILSPEKLSATEQIYYVSHCKKIVVPIGGASMNLVFAAPGCEVILIKKAYLPDTPADMHIVSCVNQAFKVVFLDSYFKPYKNLPYGYGDGPHMLGITSCIRDYIKDNNMNSIAIGIYVRDNVINFLWLSSKEAKRIIRKIVRRN